MINSRSSHKVQNQHNKRIEYESRNHFDKKFLIVLIIKNHFNFINFLKHVR